MNKKIIKFIILVSCFAVIGSYMRQFTFPMGFGDSENYLKMAQKPGTFVGSPWGYRIAVPYAASAISTMLKLPVKAVFEILQFVMYGLILALIFLWISDELKLGNFIAVLSAILFIFSYPGVYNLHNVVHVGFGEHLFVLLGCLAIFNNRWLLLFIVILISGFVKESVGFLLIPTYFVSAMLSDNRRTALIRTAILFAAFIAPFLLLRTGFLFHTTAAGNTYISYYTIDYLRYCWDSWGGVAGAAKHIIGWFGPICLLSFAGFLSAPLKIKPLIVLPILATVQILLATDVMRMVGTGIPVLIVLSSFALKKMSHYNALLACSVVALHFLLLNYNISKEISLVLAMVLIIVLLWINKSALLLPLFNSDMIKSLTKLWKKNSQEQDHQS